MSRRRLTASSAPPPDADIDPPPYDEYDAASSAGAMDDDAPAPDAASDLPLDPYNAKVNRLLFSRENANGTHFTIMRAHLKETKRDVVVKCTTNFPIEVGDSLEIIGHIESRPDRRDASRMEEVIENGHVAQKMEFTADSIKKWLIKNIKTVGPATAERIVGTLGGAKSINKFGERQAMLDAGIPMDIAEDICTRYQQNKAGVGEYLFLTGLTDDSGKPALHAGQIRSAQAYFGGKSLVAQIKANPWVLAKIGGISFHTADRIGLKMGFAHDAPQRIYAGTTYALQEIAREDGHTGVPESMLVERASANDILGINRDKITAMLIEMADEGIIVRDKWVGVMGEDGEGENEGRIAKIHYTGTNLIFSQALWDAETTIVDRIIAILSKPPFMTHDEAHAVMKKASRIEGVKLDPSQEAAVIKGLIYPGLIITGGPGTGKSTVQKVLFRAFNQPESRRPREAAIAPNLSQDEDSDDSYSLISASCPTGKGATRLTEASGLAASTVHRQIGARKGGTFSKNQNDPIKAAVVATDEYSMADTLICAAQLNAVMPQATFNIIGDDKQLTSVGPGQVLCDLVDSGVMPTACLRSTWRQAAGSGIPIAADRILSGYFPFKENETLRGCTHINVIDKLSMDQVLKLVADDMVKQGLSPDTDIIVVSPMRNGEVGVVRCNDQIKIAINPATNDNRTHAFALHNGKSLTIHDLVMNLENNDAIGVMNGECGNVVGFTQVPDTDKDGKPTGKMLDTPVIDFGTGGVIFPPEKLEKLAIAEASTVHKQQGSENVVSIVVLPTHAMRMTTKNLLYTGLTRGKSQAYIVGTAEAVMKAVNNVSATTRFTGLKQKLIARKPELIATLTRLGAPLDYLAENDLLIKEREARNDQIMARARLGASAPKWAIDQTIRLPTAGQRPQPIAARPATGLAPAGIRRTAAASAGIRPAGPVRPAGAVQPTAPSPGVRPGVAPSPRTATIRPAGPAQSGGVRPAGAQVRPAGPQVRPAGVQAASPQQMPAGAQNNTRPLPVTRAPIRPAGLQPTISRPAIRPAGLVTRTTGPLSPAGPVRPAPAQRPIAAPDTPRGTPPAPPPPPPSAADGAVDKPESEQAAPSIRRLAPSPVRTIRRPGP